MATAANKGPGKRNDFIGHGAGIQPHKLDLVVASEAAFLTAKSEDSINSSSAQEGDFFYDSTADQLKVHDGSAWQQVLSASAANSLVQYAAVALTNAQIKALRATPVQLVAAPGAGKVLEFISAVLLLDYGGTNVFTETADNLAVKYENGSGAAASETIETTGFIDQSADTMTVGVAKNDQIVAKSGCENKALVLHNTGDGEIAGNAANDNLMRVKVAYRVHSTGW